MRNFAFHKSIAAAVSGDPEKIRLKLFIDAQSHSSILGFLSRFYLKPFAIFALAPI